MSIFSGGQKVKLNGFTFQGKQRYKCLLCNKTYLRCQGNENLGEHFSYFKDWITYGETISRIAQRRGVSSKTVKRVIDYWLSKPSFESVLIEINIKRKVNFEAVKHIILDCTYLKIIKNLNHKDGIYAVMNAENHKIIYFEYGVKESSKDLSLIYRRLKEKGLNPTSATIDGSLQQFKYIIEIWKDITNTKMFGTPSKTIVKLVKGKTKKKRIY